MRNTFNAYDFFFENVRFHFLTGLPVEKIDSVSSPSDDMFMKIISEPELVIT